MFFFLVINIIFYSQYLYTLFSSFSVSTFLTDSTDIFKVDANFYIQSYYYLALYFCFLVSIFFMSSWLKDKNSLNLPNEYLFFNI